MLDLLIAAEAEEGVHRLRAVLGADATDRDLDADSLVRAAGPNPARG